MLESIDTSLIDWSRAQFALTAMYHWLFVPLTLGLAINVALMETLYVITGNDFWKRTTKFWMKLFGINFAIGVATGIILEFQFGTNWSNYSWFVGDIFGAPLAIEGILAFFMESTFVAIMFFGWKKVSKKFHLAATWLTGIGATISAWWILVANSWMQSPVGMTFNPDTVRNEMMDFFAVAFSPFAIWKFFHAVLSSWLVGSIFVLGISAWFLIKKREKEFAIASMKIAAAVGLFAALVTAGTGDQSGVLVSKRQPMKLATMEGLHQGGTSQPFTIIGNLKIPMMLSILATHSLDGYVPGIDNILEGYETPDGVKHLSAAEKIDRGQKAIAALAEYREAKAEGKEKQAVKALETFDENKEYFGYGYVKEPSDLVPNRGLMFWAFRIMVGLAMYFIVLFAFVLFLAWKHKLTQFPWLYYVAVITIPFGWIASQAGWIVAEVGRQPWAIQDMLPVNAAISKLSVGTVQTTFFIFVILFIIMLSAEIKIMVTAIKKGPGDVH